MRTIFTLNNSSEHKRFRGNVSPVPLARPIALRADAAQAKPRPMLAARRRKSRDNLQPVKFSSFVKAISQERHGNRRSVNVVAPVNRQRAARSRQVPADLHAGP